jgi:hypothetical protein
LALRSNDTVPVAVSGVIVVPLLVLEAEQSRSVSVKLGPGSASVTLYWPADTFGP